MRPQPWESIRRLPPRAERNSQESCSAESRMKEGRGLGRRLRGEDADELPHATAILEFHETVDHGEQGIVPSEPDIVAGLETSSALPVQDRASGDELAAIAFDPKTLGIAVATVSR